jgi:bacillithiol system protein YtxJ
VSQTSSLMSLTSLPELDAALARSTARPIVIFKHSSTCGTSAEAYQEIEALLAGPPLLADVYLIDVRTSRAISNAVAAHLHLRHESPQVLVIREGKVSWHASHFRVTARAIKAALRQIAPPETLRDA